MSRLADNAALLTVARIANYGLQLISPILLARLLPLGELSEYRVYLLHVGVLTSLTIFGIYESLLYFLPRHPERHQAVLRNVVLMVASSSCATVAITIGIDLLLGRALIGSHLWVLSLYVLLHVNLDFWEWYWLAQHRTTPMFVYTAGRLLARMGVVVAAALLTRDATVIIYSLLALEALRFAASFLAWRQSRGAPAGPPPPGLLREQIAFCLPAGAALAVVVFNRYVGGYAILASLGAVAYTWYSYGLYGEPIIVALRNSISAILLPEMVRRAADSADASAAIWRRATVLNCIVLLPMAALIACYAEPLVVAVFGAALAPAAGVLQLYALIIVRECFDLTLPLRTAGRTATLLHSSIIGLCANGLLLLALLAPLGIRGAVLAVAGAAAIEAAFQHRCVRRLAGYGNGSLIPWPSVLRVLAAASLPLPLLLVVPRTSANLAVLAAMACLYLAAFAVLLRLLRVAELEALTGWLRRRAGRS